MRDRLRHFYTCRFILFLVAGIQSQSVLLAADGFPVLTNAAQVRALTAAQAAKKMPVRLRGVVIYFDSHHFHLAMMDDTAGIYAELSRNVRVNLRRGDLIEAEGVSDPGKFAPFLAVTAVQKLGVGKIPEPRLASRSDIMSGRMDAQWIEVSGVVRHVNTLDGLNMEVELENGAGRMLANKMNAKPVAVDATVRLRGVCYYQYNKTRQVIRPCLSIPWDEPIRIEEPAITNLDNVPTRSIGSLMQFNVDDRYAHRIRVRGFVIQVQQGEGFWLHDPGHGVHVLCEDTDLLEVGDEADVYGFLKRGDYGPEIEDASFGKTGRVVSMLPVVRLNKASQALDHDSDLIQCDATIVEQWSTLDGCRLTLADGKTEFPAILRMPNPNMSLPRWLTGTRVRITGVCTVLFPTKPVEAGTVLPRVFQLLLRSPADVLVLQLPSWWSAEHVVWLTGGATVVLLLAVGIVIWISHRRLRREALERMKSEAEFVAIWNERNRMAREIHDTLAQGLSAISMQLEVLKRHLSPEAKAREILEVARVLVREKMAEARKAIWNVRSQVLESGDLATALGDILHGLTEGSETKGEVKVRGRVRRLAPVAENNLLRIGQEAITNAVKYAGAKNILVAMDFEERLLRLSVSDDGKGFNVDSPPPSEGGFGLKGMQERAAQIHAELAISSEPGEGTIVTLALPLSS